MSIYSSLLFIFALISNLDARRPPQSSSSSSSSSDTRDPRLSVATFNAGLFNDPTVDERQRIQMENLVTSLDQQDIQVLCLQEAGFFASFQENYQAFLQSSYPYQASSLDSLPDSEQGSGIRTPCSADDIAAITSDCVSNACDLETLGGVTGFIYCMGAFCPDEFQNVYNTACGGCAAAINFGDPTLPLEAILGACSQPSPFNFNLAGGVALLSQYPLNNVQVNALPSWVVDVDYLITADIEVPVSTRSRKTQTVTVGCMHAYSPQFFINVGLPYYNAFDTPDTVTNHFEFQAYQYQGVIDILDNLKAANPGQGQIILGDLNFEDGTEASFDLFSDAGFVSMFEITGDTVPDDCTFCPLIDETDTSNICLDPSGSSTNPLLASAGIIGNRNIVDDAYVRNFGNNLLKRDSEAGRFLEECYDITVNDVTFPSPLSDHYGMFAKLRLRNGGGNYD